MAEAPGEEATTPAAEALPQTEATAADVLRRRFWIRWGVIVAVIVAGFMITVSTLNSTVYSAQGFVAAYLDALDRRDVDAALDTAGVRTREAAADDLLVPEALGGLDDVELVSEADLGGGIHRVVYDYALDGRSGTTEFEIEHTGNRFGFFQQWAFVTSPAATLEITPLNAAEFEADGVSIESADGPGVPVRYDVLTPSVLGLGHESDFLIADEEDVPVLEPGAEVRVTVQSRANEEFVRLVQEELDRSLDACAEQEVLQPTGCPFGETITNRVEGVPEWSMAEYPTVTIVPGREPGTWQVPETPGAAHLVVGVRSIFDGKRSTFDEDVPFTVSYVITFVPGGGVIIDAQ